MAKKKPKFYVVWEGVQPGIYDNWKECERQTKGVEAAKFKSFDTIKEANEAFLEPWYNYIGKNAEKAANVPKPDYNLLPKEEQPYPESICVDAACSGNPGKMEYRGVDFKSGLEIFRQGPYKNGTNNIGEFLAIVHALALVKNYEKPIPIYSDSKIAMGWIAQKKCKTKLEENSKNTDLFGIVRRAEKWLKDNTYKNPVLKWHTEKWGEIPADFGRK